MLQILFQHKQNNSHSDHHHYGTESRAVLMEIIDAMSEIDITQCINVLNNNRNEMWKAEMPSHSDKSLSNRNSGNKYFSHIYYFPFLYSCSCQKSQWNYHCNTLFTSRCTPNIKFITQIMKSLQFSPKKWRGKYLRPEELHGRWYYFVTWNVFIYLLTPDLCLTKSPSSSHGWFWASE